jgi:P-type Ca2+ transporter type 2C
VSSVWTAPSPSSALASSVIDDGHCENVELLNLDDDEEIPDNPFAFTPKSLSKLHDPKDLNVLRSMGGIEGLVYGLRTNAQSGLSVDEDLLQGKISYRDVVHELETRKKQRVQDDIGTKSVSNDGETAASERHMEDRQELRRKGSSGSAKRRFSLKDRTGTAGSGTAQAHSSGFSDRKRVFAENRIPVRKPKNIFQLMWMTLHDKILVSHFLSGTFWCEILLSIAAVISLALGFYQSFRPGATEKVDWVEGVAILVAIAIVTVVQSVNDYQKERQFMKLNQKVSILKPPG